MVRERDALALPGFGRYRYVKAKPFHSKGLVLLRTSVFCLINMAHLETYTWILTSMRKKMSQPLLLNDSTPFSE